MKYSYRQMKRWLWRYCKANGVPKRKGFNTRSEKWGKPAQVMWMNVCLREKVPVTKVPNSKNINLIRPFNYRLRARILMELGTKEWPPMSNWGPVKKYLEAAGIKFPAPYCASCVTYCVLKAGWKGSLPPLLGWVPSWDAWAQKNGYEINRFRGRTGDVVTFNWDADKASEHIGFINRNYGPLKSVVTIEGNATSSALPGGGVVRKTRPWSSVNHVYRLPNYHQK